MRIHYHNCNKACADKISKENKKPVFKHACYGRLFLKDTYYNQIISCK